MKEKGRRGERNEKRERSKTAQGESERRESDRRGVRV